MGVNTGVGGVVVVIDMGSEIGVWVVSIVLFTLLVTEMEMEMEVEVEVEFDVVV